MHKPDLGALKRPVSHRTLLVDAMRSLALAKGFPGTTVDEICERAGVTKGSFYHHFSSKDDLGLAALRAYYDDVLDTFRDGEWTKLDEPGERLLAFVDHASEACTGPVMGNGCLLGTFALDMAESSPDVRELLSGMFTELRDEVAGLVAAAAAGRGLRLDAAALGDQFLAVLEGSIVLAKAHADGGAPRRAMALFREHLALLLERGAG